MRIRQALRTKRERAAWPRKLTERVFQRILDHIRVGITTTGACKVENIGYQHWRMRIRENAEWARLLADAEVDPPIFQQRRSGSTELVEVVAFQGILGIWVRLYKSSNSIVCGARS